MKTLISKTSRPFFVALILISLGLNARAANWTVTSGADSGPGSLRDIIVNQAQSGDNIYFSAAVATSGISFTGNQIVVNKTLFVSALSVGSVTINGGYLNNRMFHIVSSGSILMENVNFRGMVYINPTGQASTIVNGGVFLNQGTLILRDCIFTGCGIKVWQSPGSVNGGVIHNSAVLNLIRCNFTGSGISMMSPSVNTSLSGGSLFNTSTGAVQILDCVFDGSAVEGIGNTQGGAIYNDHDLIVTRCTFKNCRVSQAGNSAQLSGYQFRGGAIYSSSGFTMNGCTITKSLVRTVNAPAMGGAIAVMGQLTLTDCVVDKCNAYALYTSTAAGGILSYHNLILLNCRIIDNTSEGKDNQTGYAGGVLHYAGTISVENCTVSGNRCITHDVSGSTASYGGGIASRGSTMKILRSTFSGNLVSRPWGIAEGGGVYFDGTLFDCNNSTFSGNSAISGNPTGAPDQNTHTAVGGGLSVHAAQFKMIHCTIAENTIGAQTGSQGIQRGSGLAMTPATVSTFYNNIAGQNHTLNLNLNSNVDIFHSPNNLISNGYNLIETLDLANTIQPAATDIVLTSPNLMPLANYGGPTETHGLTCGSQARNHGTNAGILLTDQRGMPRIIGTSTDIGAFEAPDIEAVTVPAPDLVCLGTCVLLAASDPNLASYTWVVQSGGAEIHGTGAQVCATLTSQASILLIATDIYGCTVYVTINIDVDPNCEADPGQTSCCSGGGDDKMLSHSFPSVPFCSASPNPSSGFFEVTGRLSSADAMAQVAVFTADGRLVAEQSTLLDSGAFGLSIDLSDQTAGIYFVKVTAGEAMQSARLLIVR